MRTVCSDAHRRHAPAMELAGNHFVPAFEVPARADAIRERIATLGLGPFTEPRDHGRGPIEAVHTHDYVDFLATAWNDWCAAGGEGDAITSCARMPDMGQRLPASIVGRIAHYSFDVTAPITAGTWAAAYEAAQIALTAAQCIVEGEDAVFALCRPPGHHASRAYCGGYCYLNNAAIAAQSLLDCGRRRVAILDVDYHHGNGTQSIFYDRDDVLFVSIHADPSDEYPYFLGYADETGSGRGAGFNLNFPLPAGTGAAGWFAALSGGLERIAAHRADALVVSLGVDTYAGDPISHFELETGDYLRLGEQAAGPSLPTLFVMEGGYALEAIADNVTNTLLGFTRKRRSSGG